MASSELDVCMSASSVTLSRSRSFFFLIVLMYFVTSHHDTQYYHEDG